jgi:hypothetical protein
MSWVLLIYPFLSIFIVIGLGGSIVTLKDILRARATANWPATEARVIDCGIRKGKGDDDDKLFVEYSYRVDGTNFTGTGIRPYCEVDAKEGKQLLERLKGCEVVLARYNPRNPGEACLLAGTSRSEWAAFFCALLFFFAGVLFMLGFHFQTFGTADYASAVTILE